MLNRKDLIAINKEFSTGKIINGSSLDFVLKQTYRSRNWYKTMCLLARAIAIDHVFEDGNKRTASSVIMTYLDINQRAYNPDNISKLVLRITKQNIKDIRKIERLIHHATK